MMASGVSEVSRSRRKAEALTHSQRPSSESLAFSTVDRGGERESMASRLDNGPEFTAKDDETSSEEIEAEEYQSQRQNVIALLVIFFGSLFVMALLFKNFPELDEEDVRHLRFPRSIDSAKDLGRLLSKYKDTHYFTVLGSVVTIYIFLQTFAIPGSISLSVLSGFLFPFPLALLLVCTCSALGATFCYLLSAMVGHGLVKKYLPERLKSWRAQAAHHHDDVLWYIIFLRITPFLPNWFINLAAPIIGVRLVPFFWGTFFGVAPPSFFFIRAGTTLYQLTTSSGHISAQSILILAIMAILSLMPVLFKRKLRKKLE